MLDYALSQPMPGRVVHEAPATASTLADDTASFLAAGRSLGGG